MATGYTGKNWREEKGMRLDSEVPYSGLVAHGRVLIFDNSNVWRWGRFDGAGRVTLSTDAGGHTKTSAFDAHGRVTKTVPLPEMFAVLAA